MCNTKNCVATCFWQTLWGGQNNQGAKEGQLNDCLECDERLCGPGFVSCARANRRTSGLVCDIGRKSNQNCDKTIFSAKKNQQREIKMESEDL